MTDTQAVYGTFEAHRSETGSLIDVRQFDDPPDVQVGLEIEMGVASVTLELDAGAARDLADDLRTAAGGD